MTKTSNIREGSLIALRVPDSRRWVRVLCFIRRRPVPTRLRSYLVANVRGGRQELTEIEFGNG